MELVGKYAKRDLFYWELALSPLHDQAPKYGVVVKGSTSKPSLKRGRKIEKNAKNRIEHDRM
jgi:hypothetical protein